jgi:DNA primase large subunit
MPPAFDAKDLAKYPFLQEAQAKIARSQLNDLEAFLRSDADSRIATFATDRLLAAITTRPDRLKEHFRAALSAEGGPDELESLYAYVLARVIASCINDRSVIERLIAYEAHRSTFFLLLNDDSAEAPEVEDEKREEVARRLDLQVRGETHLVPVPAYIEMVSGLRDPMYRLVNREVDRGFVTVYASEIEVLLRERIRVVIRARGLPKVPAEVCALLAPAIERLTAVHQAQMLRDLGPIDESRYPPCMAALLAALASGANLTHMGRFALTAFLHTIGLSTTQIVEVYQRAPDFDIEKTLYQVEHISGRSGTEYTPPSCATMETNGLCVSRNALCERIGGPLGYYRKKKGSPPPGAPTASSR